MIDYIIAFLNFVADEGIDFWDCLTMKERRDEIKAINERMGWRR